MVHFEALIPNLPLVLQYFDFLRSRKPAEVPPHRLFLYFWLCCSRIKKASVYALQLISRLIRCDAFLASSDAYVALLTHTLPLNSENHGKASYSASSGDEAK